MKHQQLRFMTKVQRPLSYLVLAAGNRSTPLDVFPIVGRDGMSASNSTE